LPSETMIWQPEFTDKTLSRKPGAVQDVVPNLAGNGFVVIGQSTSRMRVSEFAELLELIQAFGTERGVKWSDEARLALEWKARWGDRAA
ncbi:recombination protein NinB, partial [Escherichia coli]|uniref:recombination protein NinB n=1 Tax=Escherichia coli TaxID=562 RepID=UPI001EDCD399